MSLWSVLKHFHTVLKHFHTWKCNVGRRRFCVFGFVYSVFCVFGFCVFGFVYSVFLCILFFCVFGFCVFGFLCIRFCVFELSKRDAAAARRAPRRGGRRRGSGGGLGDAAAAATAGSKFDLLLGDQVGPSYTPLNRAFAFIAPLGFVGCKGNERGKPTSVEHFIQQSIAPETDARPPRCVRLKRTNLPVVRLSLNRSQYGGCSTKYDTPTES